ncbi:serine/threonine protein kinase [Archangium lansingense]|uniref:Serine/threonine-protein kinase n=1 Tax=Archangium lansingense TaxID=2995310 RepID=A0ABT4A693_9BACT|nr:serine/threonine-protein kinase [Archangium lansinium]MCY1076492.1 serine/threonine-protein kinase [Archangium lansinium]
MNPQLFGKYQLLKKLATGGMAEVWLARQKGIEGFAKNVVVKRILPHLAEDREFVDMFGNEARIAARFNHPNIAQVYEFGEANGTYFIAMEFIHGEDLGRVMRKAYNAGGWIARPLAIRIVASACEGLYYAHTRSDDSGRPLKVVHRDISPQNILISFDGSVKLVDFGIAKAADQASATKSGAIKGKFAYMAPEQAAGKPLDHRADIFAIGLVLYELLTGTRPLKRESELGTLQAAMECNILPPSQVADVPPELDEVVMRALAKAADDRYRDARQMQLALEEFLVGQRWVATSVQVSELMETLFADRLDEEKHSGNPEPRSEESMSAMPVLPDPPPEEEAPPRSNSRMEPRSGTQTNVSGDMNWEAPPGEMPQQRRTGTRAGVVNKRTESATLPMGDVPEVQEWEAPPATEVPRRRTSNEAPRRTNVGSTSVARMPSRQDVTRASIETPAPRRGTESVVRRTGTPRTGEPPADADMSPRMSRGSVAVNPRARPYEDDEDPERTMLPPPPEPEPVRQPEPVRRRTGVGQSAQSESAQKPRRTSSRTELPEAPVAPRRRTSVEEITEEQEDEVSTPGAKPRAKPAAARARSLPPLKNLLGVLVALSVVGLVVIFRGPILDMLGSSAMDGQGIFLNIESNQRVQVSVRHGIRCRSSEPITVLGFTPLSRMGGAHVQDTLILENKEQGIYEEIEVPFGEPQETKSIERTFQMGYFRPKLLPRGVSGIEIYRDGQKLGLYQPGLKLELVEGLHHLVLQGPTLKEPVQVDVEVKARDITDKTVDLSSSIR